MNAAPSAISSLFQQYGDKTRIFSFRVEDEDRHILTSGKTRLTLGRVRIVSEKFAGMPRLARHRAITELLKPELDAGLHAAAVPQAPTRAKGL